MYDENLFKPRENFLEVVESYFDTNNKKLVSLNAEWGNGKTFLVNKLIEKIDKDKQRVIYIDCWEYQGSRNEESILIDAIFNELNEKVYDKKFLKLYIESIGNAIKNLKKDEIKKIVKKSIMFLSALGYATQLGMFGLNNIINEIKGILPSYILNKNSFITSVFVSSSNFLINQSKYIKENKDKKQYQKYNNNFIDEYFVEHEFYNILHELIFFDKKKILLIFDELDRCEPNYAMNIVKKIKYINKKFNDIDKNINKFNILISVNKLELIYIMKHYYGEHYTAEAFFDKLFDYEFDLPKGDSYETLINFMDRGYGQNLNYSILNKNILTLLEKNNYRQVIILNEEFNSFLEKNREELSYIVKIDGIEFSKYINEFILSILVLKNSSFTDYCNLKKNVRAFGNIVNLFFVNTPSEEDLVNFLREQNQEDVITLDNADTILLKNVEELYLELEKFNLTIENYDIKLNDNQNTEKHKIGEKSQKETKVKKQATIDKRYILMYLLFEYYNI